VHLNVADLDSAESFYAGALGMEVTVRGYPGALFFAAGGYHHHIGVNTWAGPGAPRPPEGTRGLDRFELLVEGAGELEELERALAEVGAPGERTEAGVVTSDPSGNRVLVR
jgi:catechol 2,3-dioxygenase